MESTEIDIAETNRSAEEKEGECPERLQCVPEEAGRVTKVGQIGEGEEGIATDVGQTQVFHVYVPFDFFEVDWVFYAGLRVATRVRRGFGGVEEMQEVRRETTKNEMTRRTGPNAQDPCQAI